MSSHKTMVETNNSVFEYEYEWKLKNFAKYYDAIRGAEFSPLKYIPLTFTLELEPRLKRNDGFYGYNLNLIKLSKEVVPKTCRFETVVKIYNGPTYKTTIIAASTVGIPCTVYKMDDSICLFTAKYASDNLYVNSTNINVASDVTFFITFKFFGYNITTVSTTDPVLQLPNIRYSNISRGLKTLYESKTNSDISFKIGDNTLKAHQCILMAQSPVFKRMFENNLAESKTKSIQIKDFDVHVFDCFLKYLYCGDIDDTSFDTVTNLFTLCDKYSVADLVKDCGEMMATSLNVETVCRIIVLSYLHSDETLKKKSMRFINHHFSLIKEKTEWAKLIDEYPKLASEIFSSMSANFE